jgi:phosphatidate cytidylyltransferase
VLERSKSAVGVVLAGLVPVFLGGPVFAIAMAIFCTIGYLEYERLAHGVGNKPPRLAITGASLAALVALLGYGSWAVVAVVGGTAALGIIELMRRLSLDGAFTDWAFGVTGVVYLAIPAYAAVMMRQIDGEYGNGWLHRFSDWLPLPWDPNSRGLAWLLLVLLTTWLCDTGQYLVGRRFGKTPLSPRISPKKTREGFAGGLVMAATTSAFGFWLFDLGINPAIGALFGAAIAILAIFGDLAESLLKRQAGVKDSGSFIPGHGGMLDRIDSLLFAFTGGWLLALLIDNYLL